MVLEIYFCNAFIAWWSALSDPVSFVYYLLVTICIIALVVIIRTYILHFYRNLIGLPPGPIPLPILGNLHQLGVMAHENLRKLSKTYGEVMRVLVGDDVVYVVCGVDAAIEGLVSKSNDFSGRPMTYTLNLTTGGKGIAFADFSEKWKFYRKIAHSSMKMFGDGIKNIEELVAVESKDLHKRIDEKLGKPVDLHHDLGLAVLNVVCAMIFGKHYEIGDEEFQNLILSNTLFVRGFEYDSFIDVFPILRFLPNRRIKTLKHAINLRKPIVRKHYENHKTFYDHATQEDIDNKRNDLTYGLLNALRNTNKEEVKNYLSEDFLLSVLDDMIGAGSETTLTVVRWSVVYLVNFPDIQEKCFEEIKAGLLDYKEELPTLKHRGKFPYTEAFIHETLRMSSIAPLAVPHQTTCSTSISGYHLPKGTKVIFNLYALHRDEKEWKDPFTFNPDRFLREDGTLVLPGHHRAYLPFSAGRRICLAESLAKLELFLMISQLITKYKFVQASGYPLPSMVGVPGLFLGPAAHKIAIQKR